MKSKYGITTVIAVNNGISAELARLDLAARDIPLSSVAIITLRDIKEPWMEKCGILLRYPGRPEAGVFGQWRFLGFYYSARRSLRRFEKNHEIRNVYVVNNDNLITSHLLSMADTALGIDVSVVAEGVMNFQEIGVANRAGWRWRVKPLTARFFGFRYRQPKDHLSGAFEPRVNRVVTFSAMGIKAPLEKVVLRHFPAIRPLRPSDPEIALVVLTSFNLWMEPARLEVFAQAFVEWLEAAGYRKIQVKRHPRYSCGPFEELLEKYEEVGRGVTAEDMAAELEAGTIIGTCSTALATLKLIRPDLKCIDFGSDYYCEHAYHGDPSVKAFFLATGVALVQMTNEQT